MYSENDFRYYHGGELSHAEKKWNWLPGGKNSKEYNHWYYITHPEKWGITKAAKDVYNKATAAAGNTETDLDDKALAALGRGANAVKGATQKVLDRTNVDERVRGYTETLQKRDTAQRKAAQARANASRDTSSRTADMYEKQAQQYERQARAARNNARAEVERNVRSTVNRTGEAIRNAPGNISRAVNNRIDRSNTLVDNWARGAVQSLGRGDVRQAGRYAGLAAREAGKDLRNAGQRVLNSTDLDERAANAIGVAKNHAINAAGVAKNTFTNYRGLAENNRQIAEQGYKYGQILANAQKEYDTSPNPNTKKMLDNAQRDYDNYTRNNKVAQVAAAAGRAGKSINNAFNDVQKAVGEGVENAVGTVRGIPGRVSDATGLTARNRSQQARANADELNSRAESDQRKAEGARRLVGDNTPEVERFADNQQRNADNSRAAAQRAERTAQNAESAYRSTPLGRAESIAKDLKDSAGTAVDAKIAATKAVKDAVSDYWDVVDQYGANSPQAKAAAKQAESQLNSTAVKLIGNFGNAKNTIEGVIDSGNKYLDELTDGRWSAYEYSWDGPLTRRTTDTRDGSYFTDNLLTGKRTYVKPTTVNTNSPAADDDDKKRKR